MTTHSLDLSVVKRSSEQYVLSQGGEICDWLPTIGFEEIELRNVEDFSARALVLNVLVNVGFGAPVGIARGWLRENSLLDALTAVEQEIIDCSAEPDEKTKSQLRWLVEGLCAAAWVGSRSEELTPVSGVSDSLASWFPSLRHNEPASDFRDTITLRSVDEIYQKLDVFYRSHWHARNCVLSGKDPAPFHPGVVQQRRHMLEWVLHRGADWDEIDLST